MPTHNDSNLLPLPIIHRSSHAEVPNTLKLNDAACTEDDMQRRRRSASNPKRTNPSPKKTQEKSSLSRGSKRKRSYRQTDHQIPA